MAMFKAFKPSGMEKIARSMGYQGNMQGFQDFLTQNPSRQEQMNMYTNRAVQMARGGVVKMQEGGSTPKGDIVDTSIKKMDDPALPTGGAVDAATIGTGAGQFIEADTGKLTGTVGIDTTVAGTTKADAPEKFDTAKVDAVKSEEDVKKALTDVDAAQGKVSAGAQVTGQQQEGSSVSTLEAQQGSAHLMDNPMQRQLNNEEFVQPTFNAEAASKYTEQIAAATATPSKKALITESLVPLMQQFEGGNVPPWASATMNAVTDKLIATGRSASSEAGQAIIHAMMQAAVPLAQADAEIYAKFELQNLSNQQQRNMLAAEQRANFIGQEFNQAFQARVMNATKVSEIANMNFTAEQQIALENSRAVNTMNLANLNNKQALVMAEAAALAQLDMANLNNRQQAAVQNAQAFLQMDMANLSNQQQADMFKAQTRIQSLFNDQAAENAAAQFNATSENQINQYFAGLAAQVSQFNAAQQNSTDQFNAGQTNTVNRFNAEINNQRDQFNAQNQIVIAQANAQWRRQIATADTAAINEANQFNAQAILDISEQAYENLWQYFADSMEYAWTTADNEADRIAKLVIAQLNADTSINLAKLKQDYESSSAVGGFFTDIIKMGLDTGGFLR